MASKAYAFRGFAGIGHQSVYETAVSRTAFARFLSANVQHKMGESAPKTSRLPADEDRVLGDYDVTVDVRAELRPETIGPWLKAHAGTGSVATTTPGGATNARQHLITPQDVRQVETFERRLGTLNKSEVVDGVVFNELGFEVRGAETAFTAKGPGRKLLTDQAPTTPTFDAKPPFAKHETTVTVDSVVTGVKGLAANLQRAVDTGDYETGSQFRVDADIGEVMGSVEFDLALRDLTLIKKSLGGASATSAASTPGYYPLKIAWQGALIEATFYQSLELDFPRTFWQPIGPQLTGKDGIMQRFRADILYDETATYPWRAKLINTQTSL